MKLDKKFVGKKNSDFKGQERKGRKVGKNPVKADTEARCVIFIKGERKREDLITGEYSSRRR